MNAKEYFGQAYRLDVRINSDIEELERLRNLSTGISSCRFEERFSGTKNTDPPYVRYIGNIIELEDKINAEIDKLVDLKAEIRAVIDKVVNVDERMVLKYRYIHNYTWEQIGYELNADSRTVRRWHSNALNHAAVPKKPTVI